MNIQIWDSMHIPQDQKLSLLKTRFQLGGKAISMLLWGKMGRKLVWELPKIITISLLFSNIRKIYQSAKFKNNKHRKWKKIVLTIIINIQLFYQLLHWKITRVNWNLERNVTPWLLICPLLLNFKLVKVKNT